MAKFGADFEKKLDTADFRPFKQLVDDALAKEVQVTRKEFRELRTAVDRTLAPLREATDPSYQRKMDLYSQVTSPGAHPAYSSGRQGTNLNAMASQLSGLEKGVRGLCQRDVELHTEIEKVWKALNKTNENIDDVAATVELRATKESLADLSSRFAVFSEVDTIAKLRDKYLPRIEEFAASLADLEESNVQVRDCVKALDEGLSLKCNKAAVQAQRYEFHEIFVTREYYNTQRERLEEAAELVLNRDALLKEQI